MLPSTTEIFRSIYGVFLIVRRDPNASQNFDCSVKGFWRSLFALIFVLPANLVITLGVMNEKAKPIYYWGDSLREVMIFTIIWLAYPLVVIHLSTFLGRGQYALEYLVPYNWASVPIGYFIAFVILFRSLDWMDKTAHMVLLILVYGVAVVVFQEIARSRLQISTFAAAGVVIFDFFFSMCLASIAQSVSF